MMDNDDLTIGRILTRREALAVAAKMTSGLALIGGAGSLGLTATPPKVHLVASPSLTEGPFFVDEKLNRSDLIGATSRPSVANGLPFLLGFTVYKLTDGVFKPLPGAHVDIWHTDAHGVYSDESNPMNHEDTAGQRWLRGYQVTDSSGGVKFKTIFPGWYESRAVHIHFKVRRFSPLGKTTAEFTSQLFFDDKVVDSVFANPPYDSRGERRMRNDMDDIFCERQVDGSKAGSHLLLAPNPNPSGPGTAANFSIALT